MRIIAGGDDALGSGPSIERRLNIGAIDLARTGIWAVGRLDAFVIHRRRRIGGMAWATAAREVADIRKF